MGFHFASLIVHTADTSPEVMRGRPPATGGPETDYGTGVHVGEDFLLRDPGGGSRAQRRLVVPQGGVQRQTSSTLQGRKSSASRKACSYCRSSDIPGCAMSVPSHLRPDCDGAGRDQPAVALPIRKGELLNDPSPNTIHSQGQWSRRSDPRMQAQSRTQRPTHHNPNNMKPATIQPTYHTCAIDCRRSTVFQFDVLPNSSSRSILRLAFDESSARRIFYPNLHSD